MLEGLFQPLHLLLVLGIALIVFGPGKLPELGESLGRAIRDFRKALDDSQKAPAEKPAEQLDEKKP